MAAAAAASAAAAAAASSSAGLAAVATSAAAAAEAAAEAAAGAEAVHTSHPGLITRCSYQPEFIEAKSHNIIEVTERLFIIRGHHSSLYYMSLVPLIKSHLAYGGAAGPDITIRGGLCYCWCCCNQNI